MNVGVWSSARSYRIYWTDTKPSKPVGRIWILNADCVLNYCAGIPSWRNLFVLEADCLCIWTRKL